jgi:hypothetical protein
MVFLVIFNALNSQKLHVKSCTILDLTLCSKYLRNLVKKNTECVYFEPGRLNYLALRSQESSHVKISYVALSVLRSFCFRSFSLSLT